MQPMPVPLVAKASQHATTEGALQDPVDAVGLGRAEAAMATERTLRMVWNCILSECLEDLELEALGGR